VERKHALGQSALVDVHDVDVHGRLGHLQAACDFESKLAARELHVKSGKAVFVERAAQVRLHTLEMRESGCDTAQKGVTTRDVDASSRSRC
jgi:hypothetical protein